MPETGALIAGIGSYRYAGTRRLPSLAFATADADAIERYVETCWPEPGSSIVVRVDEAAATVAGLSAGFARISEAGPLELLLVFLSGHGLASEPDVGFVAQPADGSDALSLLSPATLDALLGATRAKRTVVILDCCFAEGVVRRMAYFAGLGGDTARLYVASSRETQRTWEDDGARHGVFTAHLLDLLNTGSSASLGGVRDVLDVDGELFPVLCEQVPLYVYSTKRQVQEPVKGGVSSSPVTLPVALVARRLRERTALGTALLRVRQIAMVAAAVAAGLLLFAYTMLYYVEADARGSLVVRRGARWLEPVFRVLPMTRVDTGIGADELSGDPAASRALRGGYTTGVWTHANGDGYRSWFDAVDAGLQPAVAARYLVLVGPSVRAPALDGQSRPAAVRLAAWAAMSAARPQELEPVFRRLPVDRSVPLISPFAPNKLDFEILDRTAEDMQEFAKALEYAAATDPVRTFPHYLAFAKSTQEWLAHNTDAQRGRDARARVRTAVAVVLGIIERARRDRGMPDLDPGARMAIDGLAAQGYSDILDEARVRAASYAPSAGAASRSLLAFRGDPNEPAQGQALEAIMAGLEGSTASKAAADEVYGRFVAAGNRMNGYLSRFLIVAANTRSMSPSLVGLLLAEVSASLAKPDRDYFDSDLARVMSHVMGLVPEGQRGPVYRLIGLAAADVTPKSGSTAEMYAALARQGLDRPGMLAATSRQAALAPPYQPGAEDPGAGLPGMTIVVGHGPWIAALAEFGRTRRLSTADVAVLRAQLDDPTLHDLILPALVVQEPAPPAGADPVVRWVEGLAARTTDSAARRLRRDVITSMLAAMPRGRYLDYLGRLRAARAVGTEPEVRVALGEIMSDATYRRVRPPTTGLQLSE